ncbi:MAG: hypothetical protein ACYDH3_00805 [Candidatus Aminicenantales bacterium]
MYVKAQDTAVQLNVGQLRTKAGPFSAPGETATGTRSSAIPRPTNKASPRKPKIIPFFISFLLVGIQITRKQISKSMAVTGRADSPILMFISPFPEPMGTTSRKIHAVLVPVFLTMTLLFLQVKAYFNDYKEMSANLFAGRTLGKIRVKTGPEEIRLKNTPACG